MAKHFDIGVYGKILSVRKAYAFEVAALAMRFYTFSFSIGTITMLTLAGYPFFQAGTVASVLAISGLVFGPIVSRAIDRHGQSKVLPVACSIVVLGSVIVIAGVLLDGPDIPLYIGAILMGFSPTPGALARTRWTYLIETDPEVGETINLRSAYAYEGILDDLGFTLGPPTSIAISAAIAPVAGVVTTTVCYALGALVLIRAKGSEPEVGWGVDAEAAQSNRKRSVLT